MTVLSIVFQFFLEGKKHKMNEAVAKDNIIKSPQAVCGT